MKISVRLFIALALPFVLLSGCKNAAEHAADVRAAEEADSNLTVGTVQREIKVGMSGAQVAAALGSPNIVTTDEQRREVWIYDKVSTFRVSSSDSDSLFLIVYYSRSGSGAESTTQKTLTIIIKFDEQKRVRDFAYHSSKF